MKQAYVPPYTYTQRERETRSVPSLLRRLPFFFVSSDILGDDRERWVSTFCGPARVYRSLSIVEPRNQAPVLLKRGGGKMKRD